MQIQDVVTDKLQNIQNAVINKSINPEFKTLFDIESNKEVITAIKEPDPGMLVQQKPIILTPEKLTIYRRHIPPQTEIDNALAEMCTKVLRQLVINFKMADLNMTVQYGSRTYAHILHAINYQEISKHRKGYWEKLQTLV